MAYILFQNNVDVIMVMLVHGLLAQNYINIIGERFVFTGQDGG